MTPDINVLLAASRTDHPHYPVASAWLDEAIAAAETGGSLMLLPMVLAGFLRLATHSEVFQHPTPPRPRSRSSTRCWRPKAWKFRNWGENGPRCAG